jgi:SanA protein
MCTTGPRTGGGLFVGTIPRMLKQLWKFVRGLVAILAALGLLALIVPRLITTTYAWSRMYTVENVAPDRFAIVFGAGLTRSGLPTPVLRDRVQTAAQLYFSGKVQKLLMSGADQFDTHSEPGAMRDYAVSLGVPASAIVLDGDGLRTYDTCYRARNFFGLESAILVTQRFHLPRALFLCNALGLRATGVQAANRRYWPVMLLIWNVREQIATVGALVDVWLGPPSSLVGEPQPILQVKS